MLCNRCIPIITKYRLTSGWLPSVNLGLIAHTIFQTVIETTLKISKISKIENRLFNCYYTWSLAGGEGRNNTKHVKEYRRAHSAMSKRNQDRHCSKNGSAANNTEMGSNQPKLGSWSSHSRIPSWHLILTFLLVLILQSSYDTKIGEIFSLHFVKNYVFTFFTLMKPLSSVFPKTWFGPRRL